MVLNKFSIRTRLFGGFGLLLLLLLGMGAVSWLGFESVRGSLGTLTREVIPLQDHMGSAAQALLKARVAEQTMVANNLDDKTIIRYRKDWDAAMEQLDAELKQVRAGLGEAGGDSTEQSLAAGLLDYRNAFLPFYKDLVGFRFPDVKEAAQAQAPSSAAFQRLEASLTALREVVVRRTQAQQADIAALVVRISALLVAVVVTAWLLGIPLAIGVSRSIIGPLKTAQSVVARVGGGDLTLMDSGRGEGKDELAHTLSLLGGMVVSLRQTVTDVRSAASRVELASGEISAGSLDLSQRTERAAAALQEAASSTQSAAQQAEQCAGAAQQSSRLAGDAAQLAQRGGGVIADAVATMNDVQQSARKIGEIIRVIDDIAAQTNILALNAAVEAARAGDQGRGFAVVAGDVRELAQRSAGAAKQIQGLVSDALTRVDTGHGLVREAGGAMQAIVKSVGQVREAVEGVSSALGQQSGAIGGIHSRIAELDAATQQNAALVEESAAAATALREQASALVGSVAAFRL
jgi:methyl-accepting chemotaxis protein